MRQNTVKLRSRSAKKTFTATPTQTNSEQPGPTQQRPHVGPGSTLSLIGSGFSSLLLDPPADLIAKLTPH